MNTLERPNQKYVDFLNYLTLTLNEIKSQKMSFSSLLTSYSSKTNIGFYKTEIDEFLSLYIDVYFKQNTLSSDSITLTDKSKDIIKQYGSVSNYLNGKSRYSFLSRIARQIRITIYPKITLTKKPILDLVIIIIGTIVSYGIMKYILKWF